MDDTGHKAMFYDIIDGQAHCHLCHHSCILKGGQRGWCGVRLFGGEGLIAENYGMLTAVHDDPIEKKPLYHFMPGTRTLSVGSFGCNMRCPFCQNYSISCGRPEADYVAPLDLVNTALAQKFPSISYTYNEPFMYYEYIYDTARIAHSSGLKNILVTNGHVNREPLELLLPFVDAMNIDLKTMDSGKYKQMGGDLALVQDTIRLAAPRVHVEVAWLAVPGISAELTQIERAVHFLESVSPDIVLHINRYFPSYKYKEPPTDVNFLYSAAEIASKFLRYVHVGNV